MTNQNTQNNTAVEVVAVAKKLVANRKEYRTFERYQKKANEQLYKVLSVAFDAYCELKAGETHESRAKIAAFKTHLEEEAEKKTKAGAFAKVATAATSLQTRIVRYICGDSINDKTAYRYAKVIAAAFKADVHKADYTFSVWVASQGGIDGIQRQSTNGKTPAELLNDGIAICEARIAEAEVMGEVVSNDEDSTHSFSVALIRSNADGTQDIVWGSNNASLTNAVLKAAGKELSEELDTQDAVEDTHAAEAELQDAADTTAELVESDYELQAEAA